METLVADVAALWGSGVRHAMLTSAAPRFDWDGESALYRPTGA